MFTHLVSYERDPNPGVSILARTVLDYIRGKAVAKQHHLSISKSFIARELESSGESLGRMGGVGSSNSGSTPPTRSQQASGSCGSSTSTTPSSITPIIGTKFINWCWSQFSRSSAGAAAAGGGGWSAAAGGAMGIISGGNGKEALLDPQDPAV